MAAAAAAAAAVNQENIIVGVRLRPLDKREESLGEQLAWRADGAAHSVVQLVPEELSAQRRRHQHRAPTALATFDGFNHVLGQECTNEALYDTVAKGLVESIPEGINGQ